MNNQVEKAFTKELQKLAYSSKVLMKLKGAPTKITKSIQEKALRNAPLVWGKPGTMDAWRSEDAIRFAVQDTKKGGVGKAGGKYITNLRREIKRHQAFTKTDKMLGRVKA